MLLPALTPALLCRLLFAVSGGFLFSCGHESPRNPNPSEQNAGQPVNSYEEFAKTNIAAQLNQLGDSVFETGKYPAAIAFYQRSMDSAALQADSFLYYDSKLDLASVYDRIGEFEKAIQIAEPVVAAFLRSGDLTRIGRAYGALAGFYGKANLTEKSLDASRKSFDILKQDRSLIHRCAAYNEMAFVYSDKGRWAEALPLLDTALHLMKASGVLNQLPGMLLNLGDCHRRLGNWTAARRYLEASAAEADSLGQAHVLSRAVERLSQVAEATGDPLTALHLYRKARSIRDSIFTQEKMYQLRELEVQYETRKKEQEITLLRANEKIQTAYRNFSLSGLLFAITILGFGWYIQRLKLRNTRRILEQKQQELDDYTQLLLAKNIQLAAVEQNSKRFLPPKANASNTDDDDALEGLYNSRILTEQDWESFKHRFDPIYPGFLQRLRTRVPDMTNGEERLFLLIKINLNSREIAGILGITANGVKKARQRLRKRLELTSEDDLDQAIAGLKI